MKLLAADGEWLVYLLRAMKRVFCRDSANIVRSNLLGEKLTKSLLLEVAKRRFVFVPALFVRVILSVSRNPSKARIK